MPDNIFTKTAATDAPLSPPIAKKEARVRLEFLDGIRGLAALYVAMHHMAGEMSWNLREFAIPSWSKRLLTVFMGGGYAVGIFIVLSGFCLMLPVVRSTDLSLRGGAVDYLKRRAHRILPPYYAAFTLSLLIYACFSDLHHASGMQAQLQMVSDSNNLKWAVISHLGMFHNIRAEWAYKFNSPLWSVATEWQIYFLLPFVLLPIWRRCGTIVTVIAGYIIGVAPHFLFHGRYDSAAPWLVGLFAMGMAGAAICFSQRPLETALRNKVPWGWLAAGGAIAMLLIAYLFDTTKYFQLMEMFEGLPAVSLLVCFTKFRLFHSDTGRPVPFLLRILESPAAVKLGAMSYSLYLIHVLVSELLANALGRTNISPVGFMLVSFPLDAVLAVGLAYVFHVLIERRFMPGYTSSNKTQSAN